MRLLVFRIEIEALDYLKKYHDAWNTKNLEIQIDSNSMDSYAPEDMRKIHKLLFVDLTIMNWTLMTTITGNPFHTSIWQDKIYLTFMGGHEPILTPPSSPTQTKPQNNMSLEFSLEQFTTEKPSAAINDKGSIGESPQPTATEAHTGHKRQPSATSENENTNESQAKKQKGERD